jgi:uncharacterized protein
MWQDLLTAFALFLILEGLLPFFSPTLWKDSFRRILELPDGQLRLIGFVAMISGLLLFLWVS